jgi:two-component system sensor histidine kinase YesM
MEVFMIILRKAYKAFLTKFMNLSIKYKFIIAFFCIIIFISISLGYYSYVSSANIIEKEVSSVTLADTKQVSRDINFLQKDINDLSTFVCLDPQIQSFIHSNNSIVQDLSNNIYQANNNPFQSLTTLLASKDYISYIGIYANNGSKYYLSSDGSSGISDYDLVKSSSIYDEAKALKGKPLWVALTDKNQIFITYNKSPKIMMCRTILDTNTFKESGFMFICINVSTLERSYLNNLSSKDRDILLLDNDGEIVAYNSSDNISDIQKRMNEVLTNINGTEGQQKVSIDNRKILLTHSTIEQTSWKVAYIISFNDVLTGIRKIIPITLFVTICCLIISMIMALLMSYIFTSPINKLLSSMKRVKTGNFKEKVNLKYMDEIGLLGNEYNDMIDNINNLIDKVYKLQISEKEAELKALQAQINPHFLYNTLDSIYWKAQKSKETDISEMIYALSKLFRLTLNRGNEFTEVRNEKEFIENYLILQKKIFKNKLEYKIDISNDVLQYEIPKLILQPFVENSIIHGTEEDTDKSILDICGYLDEDKIKFIIQDNGRGIEESILNNLLKSDSNEKISKEHSGYAIKNVKDRLNLYYDGNYSLNITSNIGKGTKVEIIIPAVVQELENM